MNIIIFGLAVWLCMRLAIELRYMNVISIVPLCDALIYVVVLPISFNLLTPVKKTNFASSPVKKNKE